MPQEMKALLYAAVEQAPLADVSETHVLESYFSKFDEKFFQYCDKELTKINTFYSGKINWNILIRDTIAERTLVEILHG